MIIEDRGDSYVVSIAHCVTLGKTDPFFNFRQYLEDIAKEFDGQMTKTLHQVILKETK